MSTIQKSITGDPDRIRASLLTIEMPRRHQMRSFLGLCAPLISTVACAAQRIDAGIPRNDASFEQMLRPMTRRLDDVFVEIAWVDFVWPILCIEMPGIVWQRDDVLNQSKSK